jgi:hypothetical protein
LTRVRQIYEGWRNDLLPPSHLKEQIESVSSERMRMCEGCTYHSETRKKKLGYTTVRLDVSLYKRGVEYVDIVHILNEEEKDTVGIQFTEEYMHRNFKQNARENIIFPTNGKMTEDDLNDLV